MSDNSFNSFNDALLQMKIHQDYESAIDYLSQVIQQEPQNIDALYYRGLA